MNKKKLLTIWTIPIMWLIYILFELITGRINDFGTIIFNLILILLFALNGLFIYKLGLKNEKGFTFKIFLIIFFISLIIDQGIKLIIKLFYFNKDLELIPNYLYFNPIINSNGSWLNARFGTSVSFPLLIFLNIVALFLFIEIYRYYLYNNHKDFWADMCIIFIFSGSLCSLIDKIFYGGSLDFIGISNLFIADIKDIYINLGILFFVITLFNNEYLKTDDDTTLKEDLKSIKEFIYFILKDLQGKYKLF